MSCILCEEGCPTWLFRILLLCVCVNVEAFDSTISEHSPVTREQHREAVSEHSPVTREQHREAIRSNRGGESVQVAVGADGTLESIPPMHQSKSVRQHTMDQHVIWDSHKEPGTEEKEEPHLEFQDGPRPTDSWCNPWCFIRLSPVLVLLKILMTWLLPAGGSATKATEAERQESNKFWSLVSTVSCICVSLFAAVLMTFGLLSPPTALLGLSFGWLFLYGLKKPAAVEEDANVAEPDRLYAIDNARWVSMVGIMVTHFYSSIYNGYDDGMVVHEFVVAVFVFCMGHQSTGRGFTITKAMQPLFVYCVADFIWYWLGEGGIYGNFDPVYPFMMNSTHFFSPLVNYSPGGYLWFLQCFVILKLTHEVLQRLVPGGYFLRVFCAHVIWVIVAFVTKWNYDYVMSLPGRNQALIYHTIMMPTIPIFTMGTVTPIEVIKRLENFRIRCALAVFGLIMLMLWAILPTMDYMKAHWSSPTYIALVGYPTMLLEVLCLISLVPHRATAVSGLGARSLILYILHPLFYELVRNVYQDVLRKKYPWENLTWIDHQYDFWQLMLAWFSSLFLSSVLGSEMIWWSLGLSKASSKQTSVQQPTG